MATSNHTAFQKGHRKAGGRQKGTPNKTTAEVKAACSLIVDDEEYRQVLLNAARSRTLAPAMECLLWYYAKGRPTERVEHAGGVAVTDITPDQLKHMTTALWRSSNRSRSGDTSARPASFKAAGLRITCTQGFGPSQFATQTTNVQRCSRVSPGENQVPIIFLAAAPIFSMS